MLPGLPAVAAQGPAIIVIDVEAGTVLDTMAIPDALWYPASVTKMMTAYVTFRALETEAEADSRR